MEQSNADVRLGRFLSLVLRHDPGAAGITLDEHGWANVEQLLAGVNRTGRRIDRETLERIVRENSKQRYSFNEDHTGIRANQGHSVRVDIELREAEPPGDLYHGTASRFLPAILETGIRKMNRQYVHLSGDFETAVAVGRRHGAPAVITVDARAMYRDGVKFYRSENGVWLCEEVSPKYFKMGRDRMKFRSIAIDGPAGAGKSTLARALAEALGYLYVDTGAIYRTVALKVLREKADPTDPAQVIPLLKGLDIQMDYGPDGVQRMYLEGEDVTGAIRGNRVSGAASDVSAIPEVRAFLLEQQRKLAREQNVVMDGRDIGTVVLPRADVKIFLTAAPETRARRRLAELEQRGERADFDAILRDIRERDGRDESRAVAPLRQAEDAVPVDTTDSTLEESLARLRALVRERFDE